MAASTKGWSLDVLISKAPDTFRHADRVSAKLPLAEMNEKIREHERNGRPLVIEGLHDLDHWPKDELNLDRFVERSAEDTVSVRNVHTWIDSKVKLTEFIEKSRSMSPYVQDGETERWYGKDMECPKAWEEWLRTGGVVPTMLLGNGSHDLFRYRPESAPVQTLMCYLGVGDTFTPCHKDLCASSGQNLMCYTENNGSSFWFMTASSTAPKASRYFQDLFHELDHENHVVTVEELAKAPFEVYVLEQKLGDLVLVPPRSCHQVVNSGGITVKTSWSRMTLKGLITAYYHEIPIYRRVCRREIYKVKSTIFHTIIGQTRELAKLKSKKAYLSPPSSAGTSKRTERDSNQENPIEALANSLKELIPMADAILSEEYDKMGETMPKTYNGRNRFRDESSLTCDFCGCDIFQSFFECIACVEGGISSADRLHICPGCYVDGRTCACSKLQPQQYGNFQELIDVREKAVEVVGSYEQILGKTFVAELRLRNDQMPQLFRAACRLYTHRLQSASKERVCTSRQKHSMSHDEGLNCKGCHHSRCFRHILESHKVYVAEALLLQASDKTPKHTKYHANHLSKSATFKDKLPTLELNQAQGTPHTGYSQLVFNALNYSHCEPVHHAQYLKGGWYDNYNFMDNEEAAQDEETCATTTQNSTPLIIDKNRPSLKITLPAMKSNQPTVITSLSASPLSSLPPTSGNDLDITDIPMTPKSDDSDDSDDLPLTHPSFLARSSPQRHEHSVHDDPHDDPAVSDDDDAPLSLPSPAHSDSEFEDMMKIDAALLLAPSTETSPSQDTGRKVIDYKKKMAPFVLVPRLTEKAKMKYNLLRVSGKRTPYVLIPPAPYAIEPSKYQATRSSEVSRPSARRGGVRVQRILSSSPEASNPGKFKEGPPPKKRKASTITMNASPSSSMVPEKRKSDVLTATMTTTTTTATGTTTRTPMKTSPPRPNKNVPQPRVTVTFVKKFGFTHIVRRPKANDPAQGQDQAQPSAKKIAIAGGGSRTSQMPAALASIKDRRECILKLPRISKTSKSPKSPSPREIGAQDPPASSEGGPSLSVQLFSSSVPLDSAPNASDPLDLFQQLQDSVLQQAQVAADPSSSSGPMNRGDIRQVAIQAIKEIISIANNSTSQVLNSQQQQQQQANIPGIPPLNVNEPEMSALLQGMHPTEIPPTEPRMVGHEQQHTLGQYPQSSPDVPWRGGIRGQYGPPGFYGRSSYGRYPDVRPYQNVHHTGKQRQTRVIHPYFNHQRHRNKQSGFQQGTGWPAGPGPGSGSGPSSSSSSKPNFYDRGHYPQHPQQFSPFDSVRNHPQGQGSLGKGNFKGSASAHGFTTYETGAVNDAAGPPREPRRQRTFQSDRGIGKGKGKEKMPRSWDRNEMEAATRVPASSNGNVNTNSNWKSKSRTLLERLGPDLPAGEQGDGRSYDYNSASGHGPGPGSAQQSGPSQASRFGPPLHDDRPEQMHGHDRHLDKGSGGPSDSFNTQRRSRTNPIPKEDEVRAPSSPPSTSRLSPRESRVGGFARVGPSSRTSEKESGGRTGGDDRKDVYLRSRTPMLGVVTLVDEESAPAFPGPDFEGRPSGSGISGPDGGSCAAGVDVQEMEVNDLGGGGEGEGEVQSSGHWEGEKGAETDDEKVAVDGAPRREEEEEEEEDSPQPFEEEEEGEEEDSPKPYEGEEGVQEEEIQRSPSPVQVLPVVAPDPEEDTWQMWEDGYELEENESFGASPLFLRMESDVSDADEVSLGEKDDCGGPAMMGLGC